MKPRRLAQLHLGLARGRPSPSGAASPAPARPGACALRAVGPSADHALWHQGSQSRVLQAQSPHNGKRSTASRRIQSIATSDLASPEALDPAPEQGPETVSSPAGSSPSSHDVLGPYDDALSCALDEPTLTEIVEEFGPRLTTLDREAAAQAERILARHRDRIEVLAMLDGDPAHDPSAGSGL